MSLKQELDQLSTALAQQVPPEVLSTLTHATRELVTSKIDESSVQKGTRAPGFNLPDAEGKNVKLDELLRHGPVVVSFYRGIWCPFCNLELAALQRSLPRLKELGAELVAISPQTPEQTLETVQKHNLLFKVLSDEGNRVAQAYGLVFTLPESLRPVYAALGVDLPSFNGDETFSLPIPATYVIAQDGTVAYAFVDADYSHRMEPSDIFTALEKLRNF